MQGGFSFCGVDIAKFGLEYVPPLNDTYVFAGSVYDVHQEDFDAHHGGYFYGTTVKPKDFNLKCFFQDQHIAHGILAQIENFFRRGRTGRLIFDRREWLWYTATVVGIDMSDMRNYRNGFITISFRAYYPFARHDYISIGNENMFAEHLATNSGLLPANQTPATSIGAVTANQSILLYNGGTEYAQVAIALAGAAGEGITITNKTTNQTCKFTAFTKADTSDIDKYIVVDGLNGKTVITDGITSSLGFLYHDHGFIDLAPSFPIYRHVHVSYSSNSNIVSTSSVITDSSVVGKYIYIDNVWRKIIGFDALGNLIIDGNTETATSFSSTDIVMMNEINIKLGAGAELTKLDFIYKPTFQ